MRSLPHKRFVILEEFETYTVYIHSSYSMLVLCTFLDTLQSPTVDLWNSVKPSLGVGIVLMCMCDIQTSKWVNTMT